MRAALRLSLFLLGLSVAGLATGAPPVDTPAAENAAAHAGHSAGAKGLLARTAKGESVPVIVQLDAGFTPEGKLNAPGQVSAQRARVEAMQQEVLNGLPANSAAQVKRFGTIPFMALTVDDRGLKGLLRNPRVVGVEEDRIAYPQLASSVPVIGGDAAWAAGFTGSGQTVAILDTGVEKSHSFLAGKVVSEACYSSNNSFYPAYTVCPNGQTSDTSSGSAAPCALTGCYHGTHVAGIAAGSGGSFSGVAKGGNLIAIQIFTRLDSAYHCGGSAPCPVNFDSDTIRALERVYELRTSYNIAAVNLSIGGGKYLDVCDSYYSAVKAAVDNLRSVGIATVAASGNERYTNALDAPSCISTVVSVGNTYDNDAVSGYTNSAPFLTLHAPGTDITSSLPGNSFGAKSGTSMATPHVAGCWAVVKQSKPAASVDEVLAALMSTGTPVTDGRNGVVTPRINCDDAITWLSGNPSALMVRLHGKGTVTSNPAGINCWGDCVQSFSAGSSATLIPTPAAGWRFARWGDPACPGTGNCVQTVNGVKTVDAWFELIDDHYEENDGYLYAYDLSSRRGVWLDTVDGLGVQGDMDFYRIYVRPGYRRIQAELLFTHANGDLDFSLLDENGLAIAQSTSSDDNESIDFTVPTADRYYYLLVYLSNLGNSYNLRWNDLSTGDQYPLAVTLSGTGSGRVVSNPAGVDCGTDCVGGYAPGTSVSLTATPDAGSSFGGWSGDCTGGGICVVAMSADRNVDARFTRVGYPLTVSRTGTGTGSVASTPAGIDCGNDCTEVYPVGNSVTLTATPAAGSTFAGWSGACTGTGGCTVTLDAVKSVAAAFALNTYGVSVTKSGTGTGSVSSSPAGISCGGDCNEIYGHGTVLTLTATANLGSTFVGWGGPCSGTAQCIFTVTAGQTVTAGFTATGTVLSVTKAGTGSGRVISSPEGIDCGSDCNEAYNANAVVTLTAIPDVGSLFTGWSGGGCGGNGPCTITMDQARSPVAVFSLGGQTLTVTKGGAGTGTVVSSPSGINCGSYCAANFNNNAVVNLSATPSTGSSLAGWGGACSGAGACSVTLSTAKAVSADFGLNSYELSVARQGNGSGTVASSPAGIDCGADCTESYLYNTVVTLTPTAATGSTFTGWGGGCTGSGSCVVTLSEARAVTAAFTLDRHSLLVTRGGTGSGAVSSNPAGIDCGTDCEEAYDYGTPVSLMATPATGSLFSGWSGGCTGAGFCDLVLTQPQSAKADFTLENYPLTVVKSGGGSGSVASTPAGIDCGEDCAENYDYGTLVTLAATPAAGSVFAGWSGGCSGSGECQVALSGATEVGAGFNPLEDAYEENDDLATAYDLTASPNVWLGTLNGSGVAADPDFYRVRLPVGYRRLVADLKFLHMAGDLNLRLFDGAGLELASSLSVDDDEQIDFTVATGDADYFLAVERVEGQPIATYDLRWQPLPSGPELTLTVAAGGSVTSSPAGIDCGTDCIHAYEAGTLVTLTATPQADYGFTGWGGNCSGTGECQVTLDQARSVTAGFLYLLVPGCTPGAATFGPATYGSGTTTAMSSETSLTSSGAVSLRNGASLTLEAPLIDLQAGFRAFTGSALRATARTVACQITLPASRAPRQAASAPVPEDGAAADASSAPRTQPRPSAPRPALFRLENGRLPPGLTRLLPQLEPDIRFYTDAAGRFVAFATDAALLALDRNGVGDVYLFDALTGGLTPVSVNSRGLTGNGPSGQPRIDGSGRYLVFSSEAQDLNGATEGGTAIFLYDTLAVALERISLPPEKSEPPRPARNPAIGGDLPTVLYDQPDAQGVRRIGLYEDGVSGLLGQNRSEPIDSHHPVLSADARYAAYLESGANGGAGCTVYFLDRWREEYARLPCPISLGQADTRLEPDFTPKGDAVRWLMGDGSSVVTGNPLVGP